MSNGTSDHDESSARPLAERLRRTLNAARGNLQIRDRLKGIMADPNRAEPIVRELGLQHTLVQELLALTGQAESKRERAA